MKNPIKRIVSPSWTAGGTGVTNFGPERVSLYLDAIEQYGDENLFVSDVSMENRFPDTFSLHDLNKKRQRGLDAFWHVFDNLKKTSRYKHLLCN